MDTQTTPGLVNKLTDFQSESLRILEDPEIVPYLKRLDLRLNQLAQVFHREGDEFVLPYIDIIQKTIARLSLKHQLTGQDKIDFSLSINASDSGFPTEKDFYLLEKDKKEAKEVLASLPARDEIIDRIRRAVLRGGSVANSQILLRRHNFYSSLVDTNLLRAYHLNEPKFVKTENGRRLYTLEWSCIEMSSRLPVLYRMYLTQDKRFSPLEEVSNPRLETIIYQTKVGFFDIGAFARHVDNEIEEIHPKLLEKYTIGPYYDALTNNNPEVARILEIDDEASVLKFSVERVLSERIKEYGNWLDYLFRRKTEREVFGPVDSETKMIVPFRVKQELKNHDEYGNPCRVYGVTMGGNIVG